MTLNVLIAEDDPQVLTFFIKLMKTLNCNVVGLNSCQEGMLEIIKNPDYGLIITDLDEMPYSGMDLAKLAIVKCNNPYIVVCTGNMNEDRLARAKCFSDEVVLKTDFYSRYKNIFDLANKRVNQVETN